MTSLAALLALLSPLAFGAGNADLLVKVRDPAGVPLSGAQVACGPRVLVTGADGLARFQGLDADSVCTIRGAGRRPVTLSSLNLPDGENHRLVELAPAPGSLKVLAVDERYDPIDATVRFLSGPAPLDPVQLGADGEQRVELAPGTWRVLVVDGRNQPVEAEIVVGPGASRSVLARFPGYVRAAPPLMVTAEVASVQRLELPELIITADAEGPRTLDLEPSETYVGTVP